jgi:hypothetical protein
MLAKIDKQLVDGFEANQARTWVLDVQYDVDDDDREDCEAEDVEPLRCWPFDIRKTSQQGTNTPGPNRSA